MKFNEIFRNFLKAEAKFDKIDKTKTGVSYFQPLCLANIAYN